MRGLELYDLGNGELIVCVTDEPDTSEVMKRLSELWTWEAIQGPQIMTGEDGDVSEWLVLLGASRQPTAASGVEEVAA